MTSHRDIHNTAHCYASQLGVVWQTTRDSTNKPVKNSFDLPHMVMVTSQLGVVWQTTQNSPS